MRDAPSSTSPRRPADALDEAMKLPPQQGDQQRSYSFDEAMKLPAQEPEPDSALGAFLKGAKHAAGPALAGLAAIPAGAAVGEAVFPWLGPVGPVVGDAVAERGRAPGPARGALLRPLWRGRLARVAQCPLTVYRYRP